MRASKIILGLKRFSRDGSHDPMAMIPVSEIVSDATSLCAQRFASHGVTLTVCEIPLSLRVECRGVEISQVLLNLLNNAYDAIHSLKEKWIKIEVVESEHEMVNIMVTDSGGGLSPEVQQKLMQPFFTTKAIGKGTGLGLSISKGILEAHHGRLVYDNKCPNTRFVIELPKPR
jgi:C4-dicarboxylate-specific signal transduction histidine kinase